jgi:hypothetical protein
VTVRFQLPGLRHGLALDAYDEARMYGELRLDRDLAEIVADHSSRGGDVGDALDRLARRCGAPLRWNRGFVLGIDAKPRPGLRWAFTATRQIWSAEAALDASSRPRFAGTGRFAGC